MPHNVYTEEEIEFLKTNYSTMPNNEIAKQMNRSAESIRIKASRLNLSKSGKTGDCGKYKSSPSRIVEMELPEICYFAGLFDGDGTVGLYSKGTKSGYYLRLSISSTDKKTIDWLHSHIGGTSYVYPPYGRGKKKRFDWTLNKRADKKNLLEKIVPFLVTKREQVLLALKQFDSPSAEVSEQLKKLKRQSY